MSYCLVYMCATKKKIKMTTKGIINFKTVA